MLGPQRAAVFKPHYRVQAAGNADLSPRSDPHHEFRGLNCLIEVRSPLRRPQDEGLRTEDVSIACVTHSICPPSCA